MKKPIKFVLNPGKIYPVKTAFWLGEFNYDQALKWMVQCRLIKPGDSLEKPDHDQGGCQWALSGGSLIWHEWTTGKASEYAGVIHEITHAVFHQGRYLGFSATYDSEEFYTYMMQFYSFELFRKLWKKPCIKKKPN